MDGKIELIKGIEVGIDFLNSQRSYDIILSVTLESREALEQYQQHPYHHDVVKAYMVDIYTNAVAVDYDI